MASRGTKRKAPVPLDLVKLTPVDTRILQDCLRGVKKWRDDTNRVVVDVPPLPYGMRVQCKVNCPGGYKYLQLRGPSQSRRIYVNAKGEADEWESPPDSGHRLLVYSPCEPVTLQDAVQELLPESAAKCEARLQEEEHQQTTMPPPKRSRAAR